jgi:hypothetical protein
MLVGIHQPHYLPWLRYFEKIARSDLFIVLDTVQFSKNGWQNRNKIKTAAGVTLLTVPVHARLGALLTDVAINNSVPWQKKHWRTIEQAYRKAPAYNDIAPAMAPLYECRWENLVDLTLAQLRLFCGLLGIDTPIRVASGMDGEGEATDRLVSLIRQAGGTAYYTGAYALDAYLDPEALRRAGIALAIQEWACPEYPQLHGAFVPDLAIVDLLMNCGSDALEVLLGRRAA